MTSQTALRSEQSGSCICIARGFCGVRTQRADESHKLPDTVGIVEEAGHFRAWNAFGNVFQEVGIARSVVKAASSEVGPSSPLARIAVTWRAVRMKSFGPRSHVRSGGMRITHFLRNREASKQ